MIATSQPAVRAGPIEPNAISLHQQHAECRCATNGSSSGDVAAGRSAVSPGRGGTTAQNAA